MLWRDRNNIKTTLTTPDFFIITKLQELAENLKSWVLATAVSQVL